MLGQDEIIKRFGSNQGAPLEKQFIQFAAMLDVLLTDGRAKDMVFDNLENALLWVNKSLVMDMNSVKEPVQDEEDDTPNWVRDADVLWKKEKGTTTNL